MAVLIQFLRVTKSLAGEFFWHDRVQLLMEKNSDSCLTSMQGIIPYHILGRTGELPLPEKRSCRFSQEVGNYVEHVGMVQNLVGIKFQAPGGRYYEDSMTKYMHSIW